MDRDEETAGVNSTDAAFRILSLDGGGIKGTFTASFLAGIEEMTGKNIVDHFDLIVGTSTGGIIALALGLGIPAARVLKFYEEEGPKIFGSPGIRSRVRGWFQHRFLSAKHSSEPLKNALRSVFSERRIGDSKTRLVVVSYDGVSGDVHLFKTAHSERFKRDYKELAVNAALATSAAPTYLPVFHSDDGIRYVDGGIWANCPVVVALIEAITVLGKTADEIEILSVGTTDAVFHVDPSKRNASVWKWRKDLADLFVHAQTRGALAQAKLLTGDRVVRIDQTVERRRFSLDDTRSISELKALGIREARHRCESVAERFLTTPAPRFEPYHQLA